MSRNIFFIGISTVAYIIIFVPVYRFAGGTAFVLSLIPIGITGFLLGVKGGVFAAFGVMGLNVVLSYLVFGFSFTVFVQVLPFHLITFLIGWGFGWLSDLYEKAKNQTALYAKEKENLNEEIQKRERIENILRESEEKYFNVIINVKEVIFQTDTHSRWTFLNPAWEEITGFTVEESLGKFFFEFVHTDDRKDHLEKFKLLIEKKTATPQPAQLEKSFYKHQAKYFTKDGGFKWIEVHARLLLDPEKNIKGTAGTLRDITQLKLAEEQIIKLNKELELKVADRTAQLIKTNNELRNEIEEKNKIEEELKVCLEQNRYLFELNPHPMWIYDIDTLNFLAVNEAAVFLYGYTQDEFLKMNLREIRPKEELERLEKSVAESKVNFRYEYSNNWRHTKKNGALIDVEIRSQSIYYQGKNGRIEVVTDVTETKRFQNALKVGEESYRGLFNSINDAIYVQDENGMFLDVNVGAEKMYGYRRNEFIGRTPEFLSAPDKNNLSAIAASIKKTFETGEPTIFEFWGLRKNGEIFPKDVMLNRCSYFGKNAIIAIARDITERKKSDEKIKLLAHAFKSSSDCISITDNENNILFVNKAFLETYGYSEEELIGKNINIVNSPHNPPSINEAIKLATIKGGWYGELWNKRKDGNEFLIFLTTSSVVDEKGKLSALVGVSRDITKQKQAEVLLKESEERYRNLYENSPIGIYRTTPHGKILLANPAIVNMLGYSSLEELKTKNLEKEGYAGKYPRKDFIEKIEREGKIVGYETVWLKKDNSPVFVRENARVIKDTSGKTLFYEGTVEDISDRKEAEAALLEERRLFIDGPVITIKWKALSSMPVEYISPNVSIALGYKPEEFTSGRLQYIDIVHPDDRRRVIEEHEYYVKTDRKNYQQEYRVRDKNGRYHYYFDFTRIVKNEAGVTTHYHGYLFDISALKEAEEALMRSEAELRNLNAMKDKFFSVIAHDLRSPFQGLLGMSSLLLDDESLTDAERKTFTQKLFEGLKTQFDFLEDLLTWSRMQRGAIEFMPAPNNIPADIKETLAFIQNEIEKKNLKLSYNMPDQIFAEYDKNMIATVVRNLVSNAIKFTKEGGEITVSAQETPDEILVSVKDTGIGISQTNISKLFRIDAHYTTKGTRDEGGTGLGLILCKDFVEKHNGKIWVESEVGKGSVFSFTIPRKMNTDFF
ncbi:MAG: PAS domain S-box protein [Bacteroidota bacterium]